MIRNKNDQNRNAMRYRPYGRCDSNAGRKAHHIKKEWKVKKMMTTITDGGDLSQLHQFLMQRQLRSIFHLIDSSGPSHFPLFTMRLSICDQAEVIISQTIGTGRSKKAAKQAAAKHYLQSFFNKSDNNNVASVAQLSETIQPKQEPAPTDIEENVFGNAVGALEAFCRINGLEKPMYEFKMVMRSVAATFQCDCKVNDMMCSGNGAKKKLAKHNAAYMILRQLQLPVPNKLIADISIVSIKTEETNSDVVDTLDNGANDNTFDDFIEMLDFNKTDIQPNEFAIMENVVSPEASRKLASIVKRYIEIYAEDLKCSPAEYLATVNHWRHPCEMTELLSFWIMSTLQCKVRESLDADVKHMGTSVLKANHLLITEANSHVLSTYYEFCVWTPIWMSDIDNENSEYFMISSTDASGNNTIRKYFPKIGEAIVCHHSTTFRFRGSSQSKRDHYYLVTEWKRSTYNELESIDRIIATTVPKWDLEKMRKTLLRGLKVIRNTEIDYNLMQCVAEWKRLLDDLDDDDANRIFIDNCLDADQVKQSLARFSLAIEANDRHNARDCMEAIQQELSDRLLVPIGDFMPAE